MAAVQWRLRRNCSLTPRQALLAWSLPVVALVFVAAFAVWQGWWWVALFAALDVAGLVVALWLYTRHALDGDTLLLDDDGMLHIEQQHGRHQRHVVWHASMVRLDDQDTRQPICLSAGREQLKIGAQVTSRVRELTARELRRALPMAALQRSAH